MLKTSALTNGEMESLPACLNPSPADFKFSVRGQTVK